MKLIPNSEGRPEQETDIREAWSDAARAAAAAARRLKGTGASYRARRDAARNAFYQGVPGVRDFQRVPVANLKRGDRVFNPHTGYQHYFTVSSVHPAKAKGYYVAFGNKPKHSNYSAQSIGGHASTVYSILRNKKYGPANLSVNATGRRRRGYSMRNR